MHYMNLAIFGLLISLMAGCIQSPQLETGASVFDKDYGFGSFSNNTTGSSAFELRTILPSHALSVKYNGNWSDKAANVSLFGSIDLANYYWLTGVAAGNTSQVVFSVDKPVKAVKIVITSWNASTNTSVANVTVHYAGTG